MYTVKNDVYIDIKTCHIDAFFYMSDHVIIMLFEHVI